MTTPRSRLIQSLERFPLTLAAMFALAVGGCGTKEAGSGGFSMPPTPVETAVVTVRPVADRFTAVGTIEGAEGILVVSEISGIMERLVFREGSMVEKGTLLAQMDDDQLSAVYTRAEALLERARNTHTRVKSLVEQNMSSAQDLDDAAADLKVAEADLEVARTVLSKTKITAPFAGITGSRRVSPGAYLSAGDPITDLARIDDLRVTFSAPERFLSRLTRGMGVEVSVTAYPGVSLEGAVDVVDPVLDPMTRNARIVAVLKNREGQFRPGMSANVNVLLSQRDNALTVPNEAVFAQGNAILVYVVGPDSTVMGVPVTLGTRLSDVVEVLSGLEPGAMVVSAGHQKLYPGAKVMPIPAVGATDAPATEPPAQEEGGTP